jgi:nucleotide-binding universal stress UspA family protein
MPPAVLVAWDPASADRSAVAFGLRVARSLRTRASVVGVQAADSLSGDAADDAPESEQAFADLAFSLRGDADLRRVRAASAAAALQRLIAAELPLVTVLGSAHGAPLGRVALGATAERVLHGAAAAVAVVPRGDGRRTGPVAVGLLPTPDGRRALRLAARLARAAGALLEVLTVLRRSPDLAEAEALAAGLAVGGERATATAGGPAAVLRAAIVAAVAADAPDQLDVRVLVGDPTDALLRTSAHAGLLVLGSRAYGPPGVVLPGGAARRVLGAARCPVVLTPRAEVPAPEPVAT